MKNNVINMAQWCRDREAEEQGNAVVDRWKDVQVLHSNELNMRIESIIAKLDELDRLAAALRECEAKHDQS